jgi:hypothetical protein
LATCHEKEGKTASAWAEFLDAAALAARVGQEDRAAYAKSHATALYERLPRMIIEVRAHDPNVQIRLDGGTIGKAAWGTAIPVDPGHHRVQAMVPGKAPWSKVVRVGPGPVVVGVTVPSLAAPSSTGDAAPTTGSTAKSTPTDASPWTRRGIGMGVVGLGIASFGIGGYFGVRTIVKQSASEAHCTGIYCNQEGVDLRDDARSSGTASTIAFITGTALTTLGIVIFATAETGHRRPTSSRVFPR